MASVQDVGDDIDKSQPNHLQTQMYDFEESKKSKGDSKVSNEISENIIRNPKKDTMSKIMDAVNHVSEKSHRRSKITFFDFAGQTMYYAFHQVYLCPKHSVFWSLICQKVLMINPCDCFEKTEQMKTDEETETAEKGVTRFDSWTLKGKLKSKMFFNLKLKAIEI